MTRNQLIATLGFFVMFATVVGLLSSCEQQRITSVKEVTVACLQAGLGEDCKD